MPDLTHVDTHFEFGKNWKSYSSTISKDMIEQAVVSMRDLLKTDDLAGRSFLDIGCGSGIHSLAALRLDAGQVVAIDIDQDSVDATRVTLAELAPDHSAKVELASVFDLDPSALPCFDIVYSWGVLHHTGRMNEAIARAASLVAEGGVFAFALYRKTWLCSAWRLEKRWYSRAGAKGRRIAQGIYIGLVRLGLMITGRSFDEYIASYTRNRGMDFEHDVYDWLGGYPYESISPRQVAGMMKSLGFTIVTAKTRNDLFSRSGILGSGCDEYLYVRSSDSGHAAT